MGRRGDDPDARLLAGGADDFGEFYERHEEALLRYFARRTGGGEGGAELAVDLCAETFARALENRRSFDPRRGEARGWLFGIARHVLADSLQAGRVRDDARARLRLQPLVLDDDDIARVAELGGGPALSALDDLPREQRDAINGRVLEEQTYHDLSLRLGCSESLVRQRVSRGLRAVRRQLEGER